MDRKRFKIAAWVTAGTLLAAVAAFSQIEDHQGQGQTIVTILPKHKGETPASVSQTDLTLKINGKKSNITRWIPLRGSEGRVEVVVLIDGGARSSLGNQMADISHFIQGLPPNAKAAIAYMENGRALMSGPLSADHAAVLRGLHLPGGGLPGVNGSPYFCLSNLAQHWPSTDRGARHEVIMVTDGVDEYNMRYDPDDPYVLAAISDSVRAEMVVYAIYWRNQGRMDSTPELADAGQNLLIQVADATGGKSYWQGYGDPVSFQSYLDDIGQRLQNQYELSFASELTGKPDVESMKLKFSRPDASIEAPQQVFVRHPSMAVE